MYSLFPQLDLKIPILRFSNFQKNWEQCKLSDLGTIQTGNTPSTLDAENYSSEGLLWVTPSDINSAIITTTSKNYL